MHRWILAAVLLAPCAGEAGLSELLRWEEGRSMRAGSNVWYPDDLHNIRNNWDREDRIEPGVTYTLAELQGPGIITHMWFTFLHEPHVWAATDGAANHQEMLLRIYWDGRPHPDVEAPVGDFFANCFGRRMEVISQPVIVEDADSYNCWWKMPFKKSARIEIVNQSKKPIRKLYSNIDWIKKKSLPKDTLYFCARYRQEYPAVNGRDYLVLETEGKGYYVGTVMAVRTRSPAWFGEGDEKIYIDGEELPSIRGTGTEDYFLSAWGLKENLMPYFGVPYVNNPMRIIGQKYCAYRWHTEDPIVFSKSIKVTFEHFGWISGDENKENRPHSWNEREDDYATVAFWYQDGPSKPFAPTTTAEERKLPSLDRVVVWGKDLRGAERSAGRVRVETGALYLESGGQLHFSPRDEDAFIEVPLEVARKEPLRLMVELSRTPDGGVWQPYLNGVPIGEPLDTYRADPDLWEFHLMDFWPDPGKYTFKLVCVGRNKASDGNTLGLNSVRLRERRPRVAASRLHCKAGTGARSRCSIGKTSCSLSPGERVGVRGSGSAGILPARVGGVSPPRFAAAPTNKACGSGFPRTRLRARARSRLRIVIVVHYREVFRRVAIIFRINLVVHSAVP
ncbi:DUF2961 domain-containing protein [bacterium]|nr:DUF2961 domain-containing protein [bacterium]